MSHIARNWNGPDWFANGEHPLLDAPPCGCGTAACGLVDTKLINPDCRQHEIGKTIRQRHQEEDCPGAPEA